MTASSGIEYIFRMISLLFNCHHLQPPATISTHHHTPYFYWCSSCRTRLQLPSLPHAVVAQLHTLPWYGYNSHPLSHSLISQLRTLPCPGYFSIARHTTYYQSCAPCRVPPKAIILQRTIYYHSCAPRPVPTFCFVLFGLPTSSVLFTSSLSVRMTAGYINFCLVSCIHFQTSTVLSSRSSFSS